ncbi:hypothetical protein O181_007871 [Austropuccinia psidii MF-1]|uniref:Uncharacterized protein n=1 Tax=Austropuccinia psidii MF-1 TaxID=1389203 RepID=A0A9Q3BNS0_9BASI|nr:hypothetical protein [Austropuccinia psidii MF-1]
MSYIPHRLTPLFMVQESFIQLEAKSQCHIPVATSDTDHMQIEIGKRNIESPITAKKWTPISTQRTRKPHLSASVQDKPALVACKGEISIIKPYVAFEG